MINGTLKDSSLPGLLQFLATETNKLYRVKLSSRGQPGEIYLNNGHLIHASFNLLEGEDALCEFFSWRDATYTVDRLGAEFESTILKNINLRLQAPTTFVSQSAFLIESNVGLNTTIVPSKKFGSLEWQDAIRTQPLDKDDFIILGSLKQGRSLRQAAKEFGADIIRATGILYRLLLTHSIEVLRNSTEAAQIPVQEETLPDSTLDDSVSYPGDEKSNSQQNADIGQANIDVYNNSGQISSSAMSSMGVATSIASYASAQDDQSDKETMVPLTPQEQTTASYPNVAGTTAKDTINCAPDVVTLLPTDALPKSDTAFSGRRTEALPLVTIDIERLLQATFTATQFGKLALNNQALDQHLRQTLLDVEAGKSLQVVINTSVRTPASVLSTYRFCVARGYVISSDPVVPLTADLLLARIEIDQYLLQRRRINGDELRDLIEIQHDKGLNLADLLVRSGYLTAGDLARLTAEQKRFSLK